MRRAHLYASEHRRFVRKRTDSIHYFGDTRALSSPAEAHMNELNTGRQASSDQVAAASQLECNNYVAMVAHELRDPLTPIINAAAILLQSPGDTTMVQRTAAVIDRQARIMRNLIDDLMNISRLQTGKLQLNRARVSMAEVIRRSLETASPFCEQRNQKVRVTLAPSPMELHADAERLIQALRNLIVNAAKYSQRGSEVRIHAERKGGDATVHVSDDGIGIQAADLESIFSLFIQGESGRISTSNGGLGIGLFLARQFAEAHGGSLRASSDGVGKGSTFTLRIPCVPLAAHAVEPPLSRSSGDPTPASPPNNIRTKALRVADDRAP